MIDIHHLLFSVQLSSIITYCVTIPILSRPETITDSQQTHLHTCNTIQSTHQPITISRIIREVRSFKHISQIEDSNQMQIPDNYDNRNRFHHSFGFEDVTHFGRMLMKGRKKNTIRKNCINGIKILEMSFQWNKSAAYLEHRIRVLGMWFLPGYVDLISHVIKVFSVWLYQYRTIPSLLSR